MQIVLQQKETGLYLTGQQTWSPESVQALEFVSSTAALDFCAAHQLTGVQLVLRFADQRYDIVLPITPQMGSNPAEPPRPLL